MKDLAVKYLNEGLEKEELDELIEWIKIPSNEEKFKVYVRANLNLDAGSVEVYRAGNDISPEYVTLISDEQALLKNRTFLKKENKCREVYRLDRKQTIFSKRSICNHPQKAGASLQHPHHKQECCNKGCTLYRCFSGYIFRANPKYIPRKHLLIITEKQTIKL